MNLLLLAAAVAASGGLPAVVLTNTTIDGDTQYPTIGGAGVYINIDGTTDELLRTVVRQQMNAGTDWIVPNELAAGLIGDLEVKWDHVSGSNDPDVEFADEGVYAALSEDRLYAIRNVVEDTLKTQTIDITVRWNGDTVVAVGRYVLDANVAAS